MPADLLRRKTSHFVLWRPGNTDPFPALYIGRVDSAAADPLAAFRTLPLHPAEGHPDLWEVAARECGLEDGRVHHYWFKVRGTHPGSHGGRVLYCTDPTAWTIDRRLTAPTPPDPDGEASLDPASVVLYRDGRLVPCDPGGEIADWSGDRPPGELPANNRLVLYELPTRWTRGQAGENGALIGSGTFRDILSLLHADTESPGFGGTAALAAGQAHLLALGVNALELLPPEDSGDTLNWGYGTANYFAADFDLGRPEGQDAPTASADLLTLVRACHSKGIRFFLDAVMAFSRDNPYRHVNFRDFFIDWKPPGDPARDPEHGEREGFGGDLFKYNLWTDGYHPLSGERSALVPAREYMKAHVAHWIDYYRIDGLRLDSVNNVGNYDFLQEIRDLARRLWADRGGSPDRFLVVGEELSVPLALVGQGRLDGLWNELFKQILRQVLLGRPAADGAEFERAVRRMIDCRLLGFTDGAQAVNYVTSHDVGGFGNERLFDYLLHNGVDEIEARIKLAFVCLLTSVGIPMIFAGEEFADQHDLDLREDAPDVKQVDPVNFARLDEPWRRRVFTHVSRLVRLRTTSDALAVNDTAFFHADFTEGKRVVAWRRGAGDDVVIVVANFSGYGTPDPHDPRSEYVVPGFPAAGPGRHWREVTQDRDVPAEWIGREPICPWEAKVYAPS